MALTAVLGGHNISNMEKSQQRIQVDKSHVHPNYKDGVLGYDVMLLKFQRIVFYYNTAMQYQILLLLYLGCLSGASDSGIVEGTVSKMHSRPYMVSLQLGKRHHCGGALVRKDFVLTSAHCKKLA
ncbi:hypothetical protein NHX12_007222 [Muraenolepis orangiensis]|uniref:Peptidase S1 domain-containing protein n=1 Tax=Muraenolepis orangiensis TaxID=630683 RepID=A0A9Q0IBR3_9TELE|nr:hypothetical protein NHX12_007222 [Muraenolepis orangiensis]